MRSTITYVVSKTTLLLYLEKQTKHNHFIQNSWQHNEKMGFAKRVLPVGRRFRV